MLVERHNMVRKVRRLGAIFALKNMLSKSWAVINLTNEDEGCKSMRVLFGVHEGNAQRWV